MSPEYGSCGGFFPTDAGFLSDKFSVLRDKIKVTPGILFLNLHVHYIFQFSTTSGLVMGPIKPSTELAPASVVAVHPRLSNDDIENEWSCSSTHLHALMVRTRATIRVHSFCGTSQALLLTMWYSCFIHKSLG
jgi:hypothetical protein